MSIFNKIILSCQNATFLVSKKQETKLSFIEEIQLKAHLSICDMCTNFKIQTDALTTSFKKKNNTIVSQSSEELSDDKKETIQKIIISELNKKNKLD